ncbi:unnamed protein product [Alopecurus aequalis]
MPALMAQRSATRNQILRELECRRKSINVAKGGVIKKSSATPPLPLRLIPSSALKPHPRVLIPTGAPGAARNKVTYMDLGDAPKRLTQRREAPMIPFAMKALKSTTAPAAATKLSATSSHDHQTTRVETRYTKKPSSATIKPPSSILVKKGMTVKTGTPAGTLPTGQRLVILNHAVVV